MNDELQVAIDEYIAQHWDDVISDLDSLVRIASTEDLAAAGDGAPFGPGPRKALSRALEIAEGMGFVTHDCEGYIGYADLPGAAETQIGIIGHVDVVPAGPGWTFPPFEVTRKDGYLLGRGVSDDKGPITVALHAVKFWHDCLAEEGREFPYTLRVLFGANEETNMKDVAYYQEDHDDPAFLFTPDAEFPVCYGEAGICSGMLTSPPIDRGVIRALEAGVAVNAVPGTAWAELDVDVDGLPSASSIIAERAEGKSGARVTATGKSAHASTPELGVNAIDVLAEYLLDADVLTPQERAFFQLVRDVTSVTDGSGLGVSATDEHFGDLTAVGGMMRFEGDRLTLSIDFRYPTTTTSAEIERRVAEHAAGACATFDMEHDKAPFLMDPNSDAVQALLAAYNEATGEDAKPFTMKGGTYARVFSNGASFGPEKPWEEKPDWVGGMHGPDEGVREDLLKQAFAIYVRTIEKLMHAKL